VQLTGNFGAHAVVRGGINADEAGDVRTGSTTSNRGPIAAVSAALVLSQKFEVVVFERDQSARAFFDASGNEAVGEGERVGGFGDGDGRGRGAVGRASAEE
jgi:hypothetical protein